MKISVIIPTYKRPGLAKELSSQIHHYYPECEVIIIDQSNQKNPNTSRAKNEGIKKATGDIVVFFDDDVEITKDTIKNHQKAYEDNSVVAVAGRVINDGESVPQETKVITGQMNGLGTKFEKNFWGEKMQPVVHPYGCNWSVRKKILDKVGYFDPSFPAPLSAFEEVDLGLRVSKEGNFIFIPKALVYHHRCYTGGTRTDQKSRNRLYYQSYGRFIKKHIEFPQLLLSTLILTVRTIKEAPYSLLSLYKGLFT